jgi:cytoskeletal protein RodZ
METANFGTVLREARERRQVSLADVSRQTKVSVASLQLLEQGRLADLPHETFVRGFIRSYARTVGISHVESLSLFDDAVAARRNAETLPRLSPAPRAQMAPVPPPEASGEDDGQAPRHGIGLAVFVIIVLLIATITLSLFLRQQPQSGEGLSLDSAESAPQLLARL